MQRIFNLFVDNIKKRLRSKKERDKKVHLKSLKHSLKTLFFNKPAFIFLIAFLLANFIFFMQYVEALKSFALLEKAFTVADAQKVHAIDLMSSNFTCEAKTTIPNCDNYIYILFIVFILLESFLVYLFIKNRRIISKKILIGNSILLQVFLVISLIAVVYAPYRTFDILGQQANKQIIQSISLLNNKEKLKKFSIEDSLTTVIKKIEAENNLLTLIEDDPKEQAILQALEIKQNKKDSLYKVAIIPYQVYYAPAVFPEKEKIKFELFLFPDNTLIVGSVNNNLIQEIAPALANKIVVAKFNEYVKDIRVFPKVDVPEEKEYLAIRKIENEKIKQDILSDIQEIKDNIAYNQSALSENERNIIEINREYDRYKAYGEGWLADCRIEFGAGDRDCMNGEKTFNSNLKELVDAKKKSEENIKNIKFYIGESQGYLYIAQKNYQEFRNNPNPPENELGVFLSPNTIHLKYVPSENYAFSKYLATAIHEYLHFYSYSTSSTYLDLPNFLDEGVTDYLTSITIDDFLGKQKQYIGYPNEVETAKKISTLITENNLKEIYFSKDENKLEKLIEDNLYKDTYDQIKTKGDLLFHMINSEDVKTKESLKKQIFEILSQKEAASSEEKN